MTKAFVLLLCFVAFASSEVLLERNDDSIDPIKQTGDEAEANDQSKRTVFDSGSGGAYGIEKHVRLHPSGYKYLLGYRPVKLQFVPVSRPLYLRPTATQWKSPNHLHHFSAKPVVTLLPPKTVPVFKPNHQWKFGKLPVNVPPSAPSKPWQHEGWTPLTKDNKPFVPSVPLPEPGPRIPIIPTASVPTTPVFPIFSTAGAPTLNPHPHALAPAVPLQPTLHVSPINHHFDFAGRPLVPINYLPGKLDLPVPDLGVLPLGSTVPVQASFQVQSHHQQFVPKAPPQIVVPDQQFLHRLPFPGGVVHQEQFPAFAHGPHVLPQPVQPVLPQPVQHILPQPVHPLYPQPVQPLYPQPVQPPPIFHHHHQQPIPQPAPHPHPQIHITPHDIQNAHNYQYFEQHDHAQFDHHQEASPEQSDQGYHYQQPQYEEEAQPGFFQPGKTDLQIPGYLPEHPHLRQSFTASQQDPNVDSYSAK